MEDSGSITNDLKMRPNGRHGGPTSMVVDKVPNRHYSIAVDILWIATRKLEVMELQLKSTGRSLHCQVQYHM